MVRACSEQVGVGLKKGRWSEEEDKILASYVQRFGVRNWPTLPKKAGLLRCGKSCRFRWLNYLRPGVKHGNYSKEEEEIIISLHKQHGNRWSEISKKLPGRTDIEIKNYWYTHLKKRSNENQEIKETKTQPSFGKCESNGYEQLLILEDPGSDQMSPQTFSSNLTSNNGSSSIMSKAPTEVVDPLKQFATATEVDGSFSSQSLLKEIFSPQEPSPSTFEGLGLQFPLSPHSFVELDWFNPFEGEEQPDLF